MDLPALLDLNKTVLYEKLELAQRIGQLWVVNDIVDILSNQKDRDKQIINGFNDEEVEIQTIKRPSGIKTVRMFTVKGIAKYLEEGKIYDLKNACEYFGVPYKNPKIKEYGLYLESIRHDKKYKTKFILKWLFGKRKMCKALKEYCTIEELLGLFGDSKDADAEKLEFIRNVNSDCSEE